MKGTKSNSLLAKIFSRRDVVATSMAFCDIPLVTNLTNESTQTTGIDDEDKVSESLSFFISFPSLGAGNRQMRYLCPPMFFFFVAVVFGGAHPASFPPNPH